jgi:hypothetical protein
LLGHCSRRIAAIGWRSPKGMFEFLAVPAKPKFDLDQGLLGIVKNL